MQRETQFARRGHDGSLSMQCAVPTRLANLYRIPAGNIWGNGDAWMALTYFMAEDPNNPTVDPRQSIPLDYVAPWGRYLGDTAWDTTASWVGYKCSFADIDHQDGDCGMFEWNRHNEWLVKEQVAYDAIHYTGSKPDHHNIVGIQNTPSSDLNALNQVASKAGGQLVTVSLLATLSTVISYGPSYMSAYSDSTNLYNHTNP